MVEFVFLKTLKVDSNFKETVMKPTLVIMAAGMGSRYGGLKQIDPVGPSGEIVLDYSVYDAIRAGFGKVVFIIRPDIEEAFREVIGRKLDGRIGVEIVFQTLDQNSGGISNPWKPYEAVGEPGRRC